jgi:Zn-dependent protease with chaperone function
LYRAGAADVALVAGVLAVLVWTDAGLALDPGSLPWWGRTLAYTAIVVVTSAAVRTPLAFWSGYIRERRWRFSMQRPWGWIADRGKGVAVDVALRSAPLFGLVALARTLPGWWIVPAAGAFALAALVFSFLAPVLLAPLFNRYSPLRDTPLAAELRALAQAAGVPVQDVLMEDTSRRTRRANAYVAGLGRTRRIVVSDTLLAEASPAEVRVVVAHELGHRRHRHVLLATLLAMAGATAAPIVVWALLGTHAADPHRIPLVLLIGLGLGLTSLPALAALSRHWERAADRYSLELTNDRAAYQTAFRRLARTNLSDLDPPPLLYLLLFTHPTPPERLAAAAT